MTHLIGLGTRFSDLLIGGDVLKEFHGTVTGVKVHPKLVGDSEDVFDGDIGTWEEGDGIWWERCGITF